MTPMMGSALFDFLCNTSPNAGPTPHPTPVPPPRVLAHLPRILLEKILPQVTSFSPKKISNFDHFRQKNKKTKKQKNKEITKPWHQSK
jgi:hypothetical protein